jgi:hypothetical protein
MIMILIPGTPQLIGTFVDPKSVMGISTVFDYRKSMKVPWSLLVVVDVSKRVQNWWLYIRIFLL